MILYKYIFLFAFSLTELLGFSQEMNQPNVLLIMTDTQRKDDIGVYGNDIIKTPNLDKLAKEGIRFENCYTTVPACMPARATIFTGRYPAAHRVRSNGIPLPDDEITLADVFLENGYRTGGAGKFHFLPHYPYRKQELPTMETHPEPFYGFQEFHLGEDGRSGEHWQWMQANHPEYVDKPDHQIPLELHNSYWTTSHIIDFIKECHTQNEPFFAFCSYVDPHQSYNPPPPYSEMYDPEEMPEPKRLEGELENKPPFHKNMAESNGHNRYTQNWALEKARHYGEVTFIDDMVGRLLAALDNLKIRENTLIVFISDHGDELGDHWLWWKGSWHYKGCSNVPLIFNWKGHLSSGRVIDGFSQQTDIFPTILEMAGLPVHNGVQGKSLKNVLMTDNVDTGYEFAYIESYHGGAVNPEFYHIQKMQVPDKEEDPVNVFTIRNDQWRITICPGKDYGELYDLTRDPDEFNNLWKDPDYKDIKTRLTGDLIYRITLTRDPLPEKTRPY
jgi:arylsulfatase A-like enzyme